MQFEVIQKSGNSQTHHTGDATIADFIRSQWGDLDIAETGTTVIRSEAGEELERTSFTPTAPILQEEIQNGTDTSSSTLQASNDGDPVQEGGQSEALPQE